LSPFMLPDSTELAKLAVDNRCFFLRSRSRSRSSLPKEVVVSSVRCLLGRCLLPCRLDSFPLALFHSNRTSTLPATIAEEYPSSCVSLAVLKKALRALLGTCFSRLLLLSHRLRSQTYMRGRWPCTCSGSTTEVREAPFGRGEDETKVGWMPRTGGRSSWRGSGVGGG